MNQDDDNKLVDSLNEANVEKETVSVENKIKDIKSEVSDIDYNFIEDVYRSNYVDLYKLEGLDVKDQSKVFSLVLTDIYKNYNDIDFSSIRKSALKCLKLSCDPSDNELRLPYKLIVEKNKNRMYFKFEKQKKKNLLLLSLILGLFIFASIASTYVTLKYLSISHLNLDIDGDGIADLNIDLNKDEKEEINITSNRVKPQINIDYKGNRKSVFNIDTNNDGKADSNLINQDTNSDGECDINCDTNKDGWPDLNIDLDGDGIVDMYIDTNGDGFSDLNYDTTGDGVCDLHCDNNGDKICDVYCVKNIEIIINDNGSSAVVGNSGTDVNSAEFIIDFVDSKLINVDNLFPEDQTGNVTKSATKKITIKNKSTIYVRYKIELVVTNNTFTSDNFLYKIDATNGGTNKEFGLVPRETSIVADQIVIAPGSTQSYEFTFKLKGINADQNFDQGKSFSGYFQVHLIESATE